MLCEISPTRRAPVVRRGAFSLIELLAVTVIVILLVGMVAPSLEVARQRSKTATCLARLRAIGETSQSYAYDDPQGWGIPAHPLQFRQCAQQENCPDPPCCPPCSDSSFIGAYEWGGKSGIGRPDWMPMPGPLGSRYGTIAGFGPASRPLNRYIYPHGFRDNLNPRIDRVGASLDSELELNAFRCPGDDGPPGGAHCPDWVNNPRRSSFDHFGNSYAANVFMIATAGGGSEMRSNSPYLRPLSRIPNPIRTIMYEENIGRWAWAARRDQCESILGLPGVDAGPTKAIRGWHGKDWTYTRSFVDAHAERQKVYIEGTEDADGYALHYFNELLDFYPEFPGCCSEPGGEGSFEAYQCIIVRGPGWQKDTLPAPFICTGLVHGGSGRPSYEDCVEVSVSTSATTGPSARTGR